MSDEWRQQWSYWPHNQLSQLMFNNARERQENESELRRRHSNVIAISYDHGPDSLADRTVRPVWTGTFQRTDVAVRFINNRVV